MRGLAARRLGAQHGEARVRRPARGAPLLERRGGEFVITALREVREERVLRIFGLDQHLTGALGAARAPGDLDDTLCEPLARAEVDAKQPLVGVQHHHQGHAGKVMSFREHLCADQQAHLASCDPVERVLERSAAAHGVAVDAREEHP